MTWKFQGADFDAALAPKYFGFVYIIHNNITGVKYIGKKHFKKKVTYQVNKVKHKKSVESDWKDYWGSSEKLKADILVHGKENFTREIIALCETVGVVNYLEVHFQFKYGVLFSEFYHNDNINGKWYKDLVSTYAKKSLVSEEHKIW